MLVLKPTIVRYWLEPVLAPLPINFDNAMVALRVHDLFFLSVTLTPCVLVNVIDVQRN